MPPLSLPEIQQRLREFAAERDWDRFHSPKNLAMALVAEAGELAAEFQWMTESESRAPEEENLARIRAEAADVMLYLLRLADKLGIDLLEASVLKMDRNRERYPPALSRGTAKKYTEL